VLDLAFERLSTKNIALINISDSALNRYINMKEINDRVKKALRGIIERRTLVKETSRLLKEQERSQNDIYREQGRIRDNLARLDKTSEMYARYEKLLGEQEDELAIILAKIDSLRNTLHQRKKDLEQYIASLQVN
jgi:chromosome segregation ATPase